MSAQSRVPAYFDYLIDAFHRGSGGRHVHLGYWEEGREAQASGFEEAQQRLDDRLIGMADTQPGHAVLDAGCGFGGTLGSLNRRLSGSLLAGVNVDARQLEICAMQLPANDNRFEWRQADACALPFPDASFDRVLCIEAMFHFPSRRAFFREAARVLKPGGALVGSDIEILSSARVAGVPAFCIEAPLQDGYGPWPDFWCADAPHEALGSAAGLRMTGFEDATANTLPSHRYTAPADADDTRDTGNAALRASLMLRWLHHNGHLRYLLFRFDKPDAAA